MAKKKSNRTHKRKRHTIDHEWLSNQYHSQVASGKMSIPKLAKKYVRLKKTSTVGSISQALYAIRDEYRKELKKEITKTKHTIVDPPYAQDDYNKAPAAVQVAARVASNPKGWEDLFSSPACDEKQKAGKNKYPDYYNLLNAKRKPDSPSIKALQEKAEFHLSQYRKTLKEILEVIGDEG